jgi:hypothetical protein
MAPKCQNQHLALFQFLIKSSESADKDMRTPRLSQPAQVLLEADLIWTPLELTFFPLFVMLYKEDMFNSRYTTTEHTQTDSTEFPMELSESNRNPPMFGHRFIVYSTEIDKVNSV